MKIKASILGGNKTRLIPIKESMTEELFEAFRQIDEEGRIATGTVQEVTMEGVRAFAKSIEDHAAGYYFAIEDLKQNRIIGELGLTDIIWHNKNANLRLCIYKEEDRNDGIGREAIELVLPFGFNVLKLHRIDLTVYEFNHRARALYEKLGFVEEGMFRETFHHEGKFFNGILMGMLKHEYKSRHHGSS